MLYFWVEDLENEANDREYTLKRVKRVTDPSTHVVTETYRAVGKNGKPKTSWKISLEEMRAHEGRVINIRGAEMTWLKRVSERPSTARGPAAETWLERVEATVKTNATDADGVIRSSTTYRFSAMDTGTGHARLRVSAERKIFTAAALMKRDTERRAKILSLPYMTIRDAAFILGVADTTVVRYAKSGRYGLRLLSTADLSASEKRELREAEPRKFSPLPHSFGAGTRLYPVEVRLLSTADVVGALRSR